MEREQLALLFGNPSQSQLPERCLRAAVPFEQMLDLRKDRPL
jgi:hypothetical protein